MVAANKRVPAGDKKTVILPAGRKYRVYKNNSPVQDTLELDDYMVLRIDGNVAWAAAAAQQAARTAAPALPQGGAAAVQPAARTAAPAIPQGGAAAAQPAARAAAPAIPQGGGSAAGQQARTTAPAIPQGGGAAGQPAARTTAPPASGKGRQSFIMIDGAVNKPIAYGPVRYGVAQSAGSEAPLSLAEYNRFNIESEIGGSAETNAQGAVLIEDIPLGGILVFCLQNKKQGYIKYQKAVSSAAPVEVRFDRFHNEPVRRTFKVLIMPQTDYITPESLSAALYYRTSKWGNSQERFQEFPLSPENIQLNRNNGSFTVSPLDLGVSQFSRIEYRLRIQGVTSSGVSITVENKTPMEDALFNINSSELELRRLD
jgi:hypothetical protein